MIAIDTSAMMAILLGESGAEPLMRAIEEAGELCMSAGTLAEALIVAGHRGIGAEMAKLVEDLGIEIVGLDASGAQSVAAAHRRWGKGVNPAGLNFGDCFAYALAAARDCPLLFVGEDFSRTDVRVAPS